MADSDTDFPDILICPITRTRLRREGEHLVNEAGDVRYPIRDGIPIVLPEAAIREASDADADKAE